ncbi:hypothetical protein MCUN1_003797 [Malassezia cuniculi]|uniref:Vps72/YL1 C-terminal domain-containing protein n=1 Tax=Malassezia cuniculi TaxID=948313 RepID=A0AAF0EU15_9BASI|nr:hypothetical protein MCUN1_003797 [Malassezia cuniculi]
MSGDDDTLIGGRARRPNAGNRMRELLEQSIEGDEVFAEAEDDVDFEGRDDEQDIVDSDFDESSEGEASGEDEAAEEAAVAEDRAAQRRRPGVRVRMAVSGAPASAHKQHEARAGEKKERRRVAEVTYEGGRRSSARRSTIQSKLEVQEKLREAAERRAAQAVRKPKRRKVMTQDALIAEALETEEENRQSLQLYLEQEEERKARQRAAGKRVIEGPVLRWVSAGLAQNVLVREKEARQDDTVATDAATNVGEADTKDAERVGGEHKQGTAATNTTDGAITADGVQQRDTPHEPLETASAPLDTAPAPLDTPHKPTDTAPAPLDTPHKQLDAAPKPFDTPHKRLDAAEGAAEEKTARTVLWFENLEAGSTWVDEFRLLLGDHCAWDRVAVVPSRNRPFRPRQSTCVVTGLPARYRDPATGMPYATVEAYRTLRRVLAHEYIWTGIAGRDDALSAGAFVARVHDGGAGGVFCVGSDGQ